MQEEVSKEDLKHMTKKDYRDYMAQMDRVSHATHKEFPNIFQGKPPKKYYEHFDRGAKRYAKKHPRKASRKSG